jgi:hypothetical protein
MVRGKRILRDHYSLREAEFWTIRGTRGHCHGGVFLRIPDLFLLQRNEGLKKPVLLKRPSDGELAYTEKA